MGNQLALGAPLFRKPENIEGRSAQSFEPGEHFEELHRPGAKTAFYQFALLVSPAENRRREMELEFKIAFECCRNLPREIAIGIKPRDFIFILHREKLEVGARDGLSKGVAARHISPFGFLHAIDEGGIAPGVSSVLVAGEKSRAAQDNLIEGARKGPRRRRLA